MSDKVRIECGAGSVEVRRSGIRGHVVLVVDAPGGGVSLRADEVGLVLAAVAELLPRGGENAVAAVAPQGSESPELAQHDPIKPWASLAEGMARRAADLDNGSERP